MANKSKRNSYSDSAIHRLFEGEKFRHVDTLMDYPARFLGSRHRKLFHKPHEAIPLACASEMLVAKVAGRQPDLIGAAKAAILHICVDKIPTKYKMLMEGVR